jgi:hypothetical protein
VAATSTRKRSDAWLPQVVFLLSLVVLYVAAMPLLDDPDVPWHLATGKWLLLNHRLPQTDPWSFASSGAPWYLLSWLWNLTIGVVEQTGGAFSVYVLAITLCAAIMAALARRLVQYNIDIQAIFLTLLLAMLCMVEFASARPHLVGYAMILAFTTILHHSRASDAYGRLWLLPLLTLIWANSHGSFIVAFSLLGAYLIEAFVTQRTWFNRLLVISAACVAAALLNPYSLDILSGAMQSIDSDVKSQLIEWQPFTIGKSIGLSAWVTVFLLCSNLRNPQVKLADKIISFTWFFATLLIMRNGAIFMLVSAPYLSSCLDYQTRGLREQRTPSPLLLRLENASPKQLWKITCAASLLFITAASALPHEGRLYSDKRSVQDAIAYAQLHYPSKRYLTDFDFGGQVIYYTGGTLPFFMDSRSNTAYSSREMKNYLAFWLQQPGWQEKLELYGINAILVHNESPFAKNVAEGRYKHRWNLVFAGKAASVYIAAP